MHVSNHYDSKNKQLSLTLDKKNHTCRKKEFFFFYPERLFVSSPSSVTSVCSFVISKHIPHKYHFPGHLLSHKIKEVPYRLLFFEYQEADASSEQRKRIDLYFMYA